ncbi:MAG: cell division protein FtsA [Candidatus Dojkabacteria bacterium]|nr:cell division protein FtsA [Candidatus Dojkabacteria bacterium]
MAAHQEIITGVDIGSYKISTIICNVEYNDNIPTVSVIGCATVPSKGVRKGVIVNINEVVNCIQQCLQAAEKMAGISVTDVNVSINGIHIMSSNNKGIVSVTNEEIDQNDIRRVIENSKNTAVSQQVRKIIHVIPREFIVDTQKGIKEPLGMQGSRLEVDTHIISGLSTAVSNTEKVIIESGYKPNITFAGLASAQSVLTMTEKDLGVMLLDIGHGCTTITIYQEESIAFSGVVNLGGQSITSDLAIGLQIPIEEAEKLKKRIGSIIERQNFVNKEPSNIPSYLRNDITKNDRLSLSNIKDNEEDDDLLDISELKIPGLPKLSKRIYQEIVTCRLDEIFQMVNKTVSNAGFTTRMPAGIVITGGTANLYNIKEYCRNYFGVLTRIGSPQGLVGPLIDEVGDPSFATAQGLILKQINDQSYNMESDHLEPEGDGLLDKVINFIKNLTN